MLDRIRRELPEATIRAQDYVASDDALRKLKVEPVDDEAAFRDADVVFVMNNNRRYYSLDFESRVALMRRPAVLYDAWNVVYSRVDLPDGVTLCALGC